MEKRTIQGHLSEGYVNWYINTNNSIGQYLKNAT